MLEKTLSKQNNTKPFEPINYEPNVCNDQIRFTRFHINYIQDIKYKNTILPLRQFYGTANNILNASTC